MKTLMCTCALMLTLGAGTAMAQSYDSTTTRTTVVPVAPPPPQTLSTERTTHAVDANGNRVDSHSTTYRDPAGVAENSRTTTTTMTPPPPPMATESTTTTRTTTTQ